MDRLGDKICNKRMGDDNLKAPSEKQIKLADKIAYTLDLEFPRGSFDFTSTDKTDILGGFGKDVFDTIKAMPTINNMNKEK